MERLRGHDRPADAAGHHVGRWQNISAIDSNSGKARLASLPTAAPGIVADVRAGGCATVAREFVRSTAAAATDSASCGFALPRAVASRQTLSFRSVNRRDQPGFQDGLQRHHLLPCQLLGQRGFGTLFNAIGRDRLGFDDFRRNGLLLPANSEAALRTRMPLHRGPHRSYNAMVAERVGQVEAEWSRLRLRAPEIAADQAVMRLQLLQRALRRRLLASDRPSYRLNARDPLAAAPDFSELDAMADALWGGTAAAMNG